MSRLAQRYHRIRSSVTSELARTAAEMIRSGRPVLDLGAGHLPGDLARDLRAVAIESWEQGAFTYLGGPGLPQLREAVVDWLDVRDFRTGDNVLVSPGSRAALTAVLQVVSGPGDVVLIDGAAWPLFQQLVAVSGATPVPCRATGERLKLTPEDIARDCAMMPGTAALVMANPINTTGQLYDEDELHALIDACAQHQVVCVIDRVYGRLVYDGKRFPLLRATPAVKEWCVLVDGLARAIRGAGGLRVGWACGPRDLIDAAAVAQDQGSGPPGRVAQRVALAALGSAYDLGLLHELEIARSNLLDQLDGVPGLRVWPVAATMFALVDFSDWLDTHTPNGWVLHTSSDLADYLLSEAMVLVTPAEPRGHMRMSFSADWAVVAEAVDRIRVALEALKR